MRFEDWVSKLDDDAQTVGEAIITHNRSLINGHNGKAYQAMSGNVQKTKYHLCVRIFEAYCGYINEEADYPSGNGRYTVSKQACKTVYILPDRSKTKRIAPIWLNLIRQL